MSDNFVISIYICYIFRYFIHLLKIKFILDLKEIKNKYSSLAMAAKDAVQKDKESQKEQIYYSDTYKDVRFIYLYYFEKIIISI